MRLIGSEISLVVEFREAKLRIMLIGLIAIIIISYRSILSWIVNSVRLFRSISVKVIVLIS